MSNSNHVFVGLPALIKNAAASDPIVSAGDNHISGIGFFDAITGGTVNRDSLGTNFRNTNFLAVVGTAVYFYTGTDVTDPNWTNSSNWTELTNSVLTTAIADIAANAGDIINLQNADVTLTNAINANTSAIQSNDTDISNLQGSVATNTTDISTNAGDISTNTTNITTNASGIATNAANISGNDTDIATNASNISTNASAITTLDGLVVKKADSIDELNDVDTTSVVPVDGEVLKWDGQNWVPGAGGGVVRVEAKNATATNFSKGDAVYVSGTATSGKPEIELADNNGTATYPAIGLLEDDLNAGDEGFVVVSGSIFNLDTLSFAAGDSLYVDSTPGALVNTRPDGATTKVQKVALVKKSHGTSGSVIVMGAGRTNDIPNIGNGNFWLGNTNGVAQEQGFDSYVGAATQVQANLTNIATNAGNISTNATNITTNASAISTNSSAISTNATDISTNAGNIATNASGISTNATNIATNATDISGNSADIATNTSDIATNASDISALQTDTSGNLTNSVTVHNDVTNAGSGQIITAAERTALGNALQPGDNVSDLNNNASYITALQAPVQSVNSLSGTVVLDADHIDDAATTHKFTTATDIAKLATIASGAEVNVNADWNATSGDAEILNKPVIPTAYTDSDVDTHLNTGTASSNEVLSWTGSDYDWVAQSGGSSNQRTLAIGVSNNDWSGDVVTFGALSGGGNFTQGKLYVWKGGLWEEAFAQNTTASIGMLAIATDSSTTKMLTRGTFTSSSMTSFTTANTLYVSANQGGSGRMMDTIPGSPPSGAVIRVCGYVINGTNGQVFFDPSKDYITIA